MFELLVVVLFAWLFFKSIGLAFRLTWSVAKVIATVLFALAVPVLIGCVALAGGLVLLLPLAMVAAAFGILKALI